MPGPAPVRSLHTLEHVLGTDPAVVRGFARAAADRLDLGPMNLADRDRLLGRGERLGLRRFDANLVLAAVEHRHRETSPPVRSVVDPVRPGNANRWAAAAAAVVLQGVIVTGMWWLLA